MLDMAAGTTVSPGSGPLASEHLRSQEQLSPSLLRIVYVVRVTMIGTENRF